MLNGAPGLSAKKSNRRWLVWLAGSFVAAALLFLGLYWLMNIFPEPREAPEAERVLSAQVGLPFQALIPAYLPKAFDRKNVLITTDQPGPQGQAMLQLAYVTRQGYSLTLSEWASPSPESAQDGANARRCVCVCQTNQQCSLVGMEFSVGAVRVSVKMSAPNLLARDQMQFILDTLGPAANRQIYSSMKEVPLSYSVPPAVDIPTNPEGIQEITLVVSPDGYSPVHFAVKKDVPVRLTFRQLGEVGCGNELIFQWEANQSATLTLASPADKQTLEFTPGQAGEFRFNCPHQIYRGVMTVTE